MTYTAIFVTGKDTFVVEDRIVSQSRLQCCPMAITTCPKLVRSFRPKWQHHHLTIASTIVSIIQCFQCSSTGLDQYLKARPRLDASLLQCVLRSSCCNGEIDPIAKVGGMRGEKCEGKG